MRNRIMTKLDRNAVLCKGATWVLTCGLLAGLPLGRAGAEEPDAPSRPAPSFRIETELFQGEAIQPASRHLILFDRGVAYDIDLVDQRSVIVVDPTRHRVILLDKREKVKTVLPTESLVRVTAQLRAAVEQEGRTATFGLDAQPTEDPNQPGTYSIAFGKFHYRTTTQTVRDPELAYAYNEFAAWAARLNVHRRRGVPPFGRLALGEAIATAGRLPLDLRLDVRHALKSEQFRAHHLVVEKLSDLDRQAIRTIGGQLTEFREVPLEQFPSELQ